MVSDVKHIPQAPAHGDAAVADDLLPLVYEELRRDERMWTFART
jgi:hypothetical protein